MLPFPRLCCILNFFRPNHVHSFLSVFFFTHFIVCLFRIARVYFALSLFCIMFVFLFCNRIVMSDLLCLIVTGLIVQDTRNGSAVVFHQVSMYITRRTTYIINATNAFPCMPTQPHIIQWSKQTGLASQSHQRYTLSELQG